jgi:excisionase family DNA binding protein
MEKLVDTAEAAELLGLGARTVRALERAGVLPAVRIRRRVLFRPATLDEFAQRHETRAERAT